VGLRGKAAKSEAKRRGGRLRLPIAFSVSGKDPPGSLVHAIAPLCYAFRNRNPVVQTHACPASLKNARFSGRCTPGSLAGVDLNRTPRT
jgi:hypothetical protein